MPKGSNLHEREINKIVYRKKNKDTGVMEESNREIIPLSIPKVTDTVMSLDVSSLTETQQKEIQKYLIAYNDYIKEFQNKMFNLTDWIEHSEGKKLDLKYRKFKMTNIEV